MGCRDVRAGRLLVTPGLLLAAWLLLAAVVALRAAARASWEFGPLRKARRCQNQQPARPVVRA